jgi:DNA invertase Pin-like site-specific DNA recombinase
VRKKTLAKKRGKKPFNSLYPLATLQNICAQKNISLFAYVEIIFYLWSEPFKEPPTMKNRVGILARVSTADQSNDRQISELTAYADSRGYEVVQFYTENISGSTANADRPVIQDLLKLATAGKVDKVLVHEVSRLGRDTGEILNMLKELHNLKISVCVLQYQIETLNDNGSVNSLAQFLLTILADVGRMEKQTLIERINSGLQEAKRKGVKLGRKAGTSDTKEKLTTKYKKALKMLADGRTVRETATLTGCAPSTLTRLKKKLATTT